MKLTVEDEWLALTKGVDIYLDSIWSMRTYRHVVRVTVNGRREVCNNTDFYISWLSTDDVEWFEDDLKSNRE